MRFSYYYRPMLIFHQRGIAFEKSNENYRMFDLSRELQFSTISLFGAFLSSIHELDWSAHGVVSKIYVTDHKLWEREKFWKGEKNSTNATVTDWSYRKKVNGKKGQFWAFSQFRWESNHEEWKHVNHSWVRVLLLCSSLNASQSEIVLKEHIYDVRIFPFL